VGVRRVGVNGVSMNMRSRLPVFPALTLTGPRRFELVFPTARI
jgi:hypothetical protein